MNDLYGNGRHIKKNDKYTYRDIDSIDYVDRRRAEFLLPPLWKQAEIDEITEDDWEINELKDPYGAYRIKHYDSEVFSCGSLGSEGHFNGFKLQCEKDNTIEYCTVSRFVDGQIKVEYVINNEN